MKGAPSLMRAGPLAWPETPLGWLSSLAGAALLAWLTWHVLDWAVLRAVFRPDAQACRALAHAGACWGVVAEKARPILFGHYPYAAQWRPALVLLSLALLCLVLWGLGWRRALSPAGLCAWPVWLLGSSLLLHGGFGGLSAVPFDAWGGLPLTLWLFGLSLLASAPLALVLALARRARAPWLSWPATVLIELVRGVPLVTLLFMAAFMLPMLLPRDHPLPLVWRAAGALTIFSAAYLAEVVRGGLQTVPDEQREAAAILGLNWWHTQWRVVLPQALRAVLPALVGHAIGLLKDSSLVLVVGLHELTGGLSLSLGGDPLWRPFYLEAYLAVGLVYALMCLALSRLGSKLESHTAAWAGTRQP